MTVLPGRRRRHRHQTLRTVENGIVRLLCRRQQNPAGGLGPADGRGRALGRRLPHRRQDRSSAIGFFGAKIVGQFPALAQVVGHLHEKRVLLAFRERPTTTARLLDTAQPIAGPLVGFRHSDADFQPARITAAVVRGLSCGTLYEGKALSEFDVNLAAFRGFRELFGIFGRLTAIVREAFENLLLGGGRHPQRLNVLFMLRNPSLLMVPLLGITIMLAKSELFERNQIMAEPSEYLTRKEAAGYLARIGCPISAATLQKYAANNNAGKGPPFVRYRWRLVRYKRTDLDLWAKREGVRIG